MTLFTRIANRLKREMHRQPYLLALRGILDTPPCPKGKNPFVLLSMVHHRDTLSYLVAAKSFIRFMQPERVALVCDPTLNAEDQAIIRRHIPHIEFYPATDFQNPRLPTGGTWERLQCITHLNKEAYVVQMDADTLTFGLMEEVLAAVRQGTGFVIGEEPNQAILSLAQASSDTAPFLKNNPHIQDISEWTISRIDLPENRCYVRGCSGFTGFPANQENTERLIDFSERMAGSIGEAWWKWGTEQVSSNYLVANTHDARVLPYPKYSNPPDVNAKTVFCHYIGSHRFTNRNYELATRRIIRELKHPSAG